MPSVSYDKDMERSVVKQGSGVGTVCRCMLLAGICCLALLLGGCGTTYIVAPNYGAGYDTSSLGARVAQTARSQIGIHYRLGGTTPSKGFDCSGLIWWAYRQNGVNVPRVTDAQAKAGIEVGGNPMRPGDILVFDTNRGRTGLHTGLYTGNGRFVHSPTSGKLVREDTLRQEYWRTRLIRIRRVVR